VRIANELHRRLSPNLEIEISNGGWKIWHRWSDLQNPSSSDVPWQQQMFYAEDHDGEPYPRSDNSSLPARPQTLAQHR
jgi:hypothetical protein